MEITKIEAVTFVRNVHGIWQACDKRNATHVAIATVDELIFISVDCENFCLLKEVICNE